jgi:tetratricopeptide (TPR) repeat protein
VAAQYVAACIGLADIALRAGNSAEALGVLERTLTYPINLGEGKLPGANENNIHYLRGIAYTALGQHEAARAAWQLACRGESQPTSAIYYNDQPPDMIFYQGLAWRRLGDEAQAQRIFQRLISYGQQHRDDEVRTDYFAVSLPSFLVFNDDPTLRNHIHCRYMEALGCLGLGDVQTDDCFAQLIALAPYHLGASYHRTFAHC